MLKVKPKLAPGHELPNKPVYWFIWVLEEESRKQYHSRGFSEKHLTPKEASLYYYGIPPTENMVFWNMGTTIAGGRKMMRQIQQEWIKAGGK